MTYHCMFPHIFAQCAVFSRLARVDGFNLPVEVTDDLATVFLELC